MSFLNKLSAKTAMLLCTGFSLASWALVLWTIFNIYSVFI